MNIESHSPMTVELMPFAHLSDTLATVKQATFVASYGIDISGFFLYNQTIEA